MAAFANAATISGITNWAIVTWETFCVFFLTFSKFRSFRCEYLFGDPECRLGKIWRSLIFLYSYQARVDLLQTSCGPGLGQVWAWLSILLWNRLSIKRLSNINYRFLFGIERFTNLVALCEGNNGARWKVHLAEQEVHGVENVWLQGPTSLHLMLKTWRKETRWQECIKLACKRNSVWEEKVEHQTFSEDS